MSPKIIEYFAKLLAPILDNVFGRKKILEDMSSMRRELTQYTDGLSETLDEIIEINKALTITQKAVMKVKQDLEAEIVSSTVREILTELVHDTIENLKRMPTFMQALTHEKKGDRVSDNAIPRLVLNFRDSFIRFVQSYNYYRQYNNNEPTDVTKREFQTKLELTAVLKPLIIACYNERIIKSSEIRQDVNGVLYDFETFLQKHRKLNEILVVLENRVKLNNLGTPNAQIQLFGKIAKDLLDCFLVILQEFKSLEKVK